MPVKLSSRSPTNFLDRRVDELALPKHGTKLDKKRVTLERAESTLPVIAFDFCFSRPLGARLGVVADKGGTCLVLFDVDWMLEGGSRSSEDGH